MKINWKVRFKNPQTVLALAAGLLLLIEQILNLFGVQLEAAFGEQVMTIVETVLGIMVILGIVQDPTTRGISDSNQAMSYERPKEKGAKQ